MERQDSLVLCCLILAASPLQGITADLAQDEDDHIPGNSLNHAVVESPPTVTGEHGHDSAGDFDHDLEHKQGHKQGQLQQLQQLQQQQRQPDIRELKPRRYDISNLGNDRLFQGWADVQGQGAANDYCRVIGQHPKSYFLSCALAGSQGQAHTYVSERGFDVGHRHTWFMRDMDGDGRDDYCRCVGRELASHITCMKAGSRGFHGGITQPGQQHTFRVQTAGPCFHKTFHPLFGLR